MTLQMLQMPEKKSMLSRGPAPAGEGLNRGIPAATEDETAAEEEDAAFDAPGKNDATVDDDAEGEANAFDEPAGEGLNR